MGEVKKRAWLYCCIDAPEDTHGILKIQKKELQNYAEHMGFEIVGSSEDLGCIPLFERPGRAECMVAAETGKMDVLIIKSFSRIGQDAAEFLHELNRCGVTLYSPMEGEISFCRQGGPSHAQPC